jgi:hypothetical protein
MAYPFVTGGVPRGFGGLSFGLVTGFVTLSIDRLSL